MGAIAGALMAGRQAAQATQQLQQGVSPGVRASGPFAKQIAQAQAQRGQRKPDNRNFQQQSGAGMNAANAGMKAAGAMRRA